MNRPPPPAAFAFLAWGLAGGTALSGLVPTGAAAEPLSVRVVNGTTGGEGSADLLTLYRLGEGMEPVASVEDPGAATVLEVPDGPPGPFLLQATFDGVNYNAPLRPGPDGRMPRSAEIVVYERFSDWRPEDMGLSTWRVLYRRLPPSLENDRLRVDEIYVVRNASDPPRTFFEERGALRFLLPAGVAVSGELRVSATGGTGMPVPQSPFPVGNAEDSPDGTETYAVRTAFKPGETEVVVSYQIPYSGERAEIMLRAPRASPEVLLLAAPADIAMALPEGAAPGWEILGPDPDVGMTVARKENVAEGEPVRLVLSGGSLPREAFGGPTGGRGAGLRPLEAPGAGPRIGTVGRLPDPTLGSKWALALLMAAALGFGLLHRAFPGRSGGSGGSDG